MKKTAWTVLLLLACSAVSTQAALAPPAAEPKVTLSLKQEAVPAALAALFRQARLSYRLEGRAIQLSGLTPNRRRQSQGCAANRRVSRATFCTPARRKQLSTSTRHKASVWGSLPVCT